MKIGDIDEINNELRICIENKRLGAEIIENLIPQGVPHQFETALWDYKEALPVLASLSDSNEKKDYKAALGGLVKDIVSFYNSYGGYIIFGVKDKGKNRLVGCASELDTGDLNRRIHGWTGKNIECYFKNIIHNEIKENIQFGILFIPRRPNGVSPVSFLKEGPVNSNGKKAFSKGVYVRIVDECRPAAATDQDWTFLFSNRSHSKSYSTRKLPNKLPARDPDLIKFVGRENILTNLRNWILDPKSPVKLLTGIGGLGKTTIAYRFSEEIIDTGAGGIELVIWLTAKASTYSALMGEMVETTRVDFADLKELLEKIIIEIAGPSSIDDEMELEDLIEKTIETLNIYPCFIIIDDIDSLEPAEQKETVSVLQQIAFRTVDRDVVSSKVLMTSRLDQGLSPTSVIKVDGLELDNFREHVCNLCKTFDVSIPNNKLLQEIYKVTLGSPLFAGSLIRLASLGEDIKKISFTWKGKDGEEVREFAFKRELESLNTHMASVLLAIISLGEASLEDLEEVLEASRKKIRDSISMLQSFHLVATAQNKLDVTIIQASKDLSAVRNILKKRLGNRAIPVERGCARLKSKDRTDSKTIGIKIRQIISCWDEENFDEAIIVAEELCKKNPKSADGYSVLGASYLKAKPPKYQKADQALTEALKLHCTRKELWPNIVEAKIGVEDWQGLRSLTKNLTSLLKSDDHILDGYCISTQKLIEIASNRRDYQRIENLSFEAINKINVKISTIALANHYFEKLREIQEYFAKSYIIAIQQLYDRPGDQLEMFNGICQLAQLKVAKFSDISIACNSLKAWWGDVEERPVIDLEACHILKDKLVDLEQLAKSFEAKNHTAPNLQNLLEATYRDLSHRGGELQKKSLSN